MNKSYKNEMNVNLCLVSSTIISQELKALLKDFDLLSFFVDSYLVIYNRLLLSQFFQ